MSTVVLPHRHPRPGPVALAALVVWAVLFAALGAVVVEPALHWLVAAPPTRVEARREATRPLPPPPINDIVLDGSYASEGLTLRAEGARLTFGAARIVTAPHRLALAAEPAAQGVSFATALGVPDNVQIEIRRIETGTAAPLCAGGEAGWLAMAVRADGVSLLPLRAGDPPGPSLSPTALCPVRMMERR